MKKSNRKKSRWVRVYEPQANKSTAEDLPPLPILFAYVKKQDAQFVSEQVPYTEVVAVHISNDGFLPNPTACCYVVMPEGLPLNLTPQQFAKCVEQDSEKIDEILAEEREKEDKEKETKQETKGETDGSV
jgi:hypothetical protein